MRSALLPLVLGALVAACSQGRDAPPPAPTVAFEGEPAESSRVEYPVSRGDRSGPVAGPDVQPLLSSAFLAPPDRSLVRVDLAVVAPTRAGAGSRVRELGGALVRHLGQGEHCSATIFDFDALRRVDDGWRAGASLRLVVDLSGLQRPEPRFARVEACMAAFDRLGPELGGAELAVSDPIADVADPDAYREALLALALDDVEAVEAQAGRTGVTPPPGFRCTSRGTVRVGLRSFRGVELSVDLACGPQEPVATPDRPPAAPPSPAPPPTGG
ncbi:MAG: hypothetical protein ACFCGT_13790 [Sandaracinaceae bacterium]